MDDPYPTLTLMGIRNPSQIQSYSQSRASPSRDILRIKYRRPAGSWLATTRSYEFDRAAAASDAGGISGSLTSYEISPILNDAVTELDSLLAADRSKEERLESILSLIEEVERSFSGEMAHLRDRVRALKDMP